MAARCTVIVNLLAAAVIIFSSIDHAQGHQMQSRRFQDVLARFSMDEMLHVRNRRGTAQEVSNELLEAVLKIERMQKKFVSSDDSDDDTSDSSSDSDDDTSDSSSDSDDDTSDSSSDSDDDTWDSSGDSDDDTWDSSDDCDSSESSNDCSKRRKLLRRVDSFCGLVNYTTEPQPEECGRYRSINGICNNIANPNWGKAGYPYLRLLPSAYKNGVNKPRWYKSTAIEVSKAFVRNGESPYSTFRATELLMHFGQFLDHDINLTPALRVNCSCDDYDKRLCLPIPCTEPEDQINVCSSKPCIPFVRSRPTVAGDCKPGPRTHDNAITAFVDASNVYGSFKQEADYLREKVEGKLKIHEEPIDEGHIHLLPPDRENAQCVMPGDEVHCGRGGDVRAAEQPGLTSLHTLFVREHNRIAEGLAFLHSDWDDEKLYQETRRILIAVMQKITYDEFLPIVLGKDKMDEYKLGSWTGYEGYDEEINPTLSNELAAAFMRFGHSMIPDNITRVSSLYDHDQFPSIEMRSSFFNAAHLYEYGSVSSLLLGMICSELLPVDRNFAKAITNHLFEDPVTRSDGTDLVALNIQRGRDHGLPPYHKYRKHCNLEVPSSWDDLRKWVDDDIVDSLKPVYKSVEKIDVFVGYHMEEPLDGAIVGGTAACVLGEEFAKLKYGDRYWYENTNNDEDGQKDGGWTEEQVAAIKEVTFARLICDNIHVESIQPAVFKLPQEEVSDNGSLKFFYKMILEDGYPDEKGQLPNFNNHRVRCDNYEAIPRLNLDAWAGL